jgi:ABC-2 type transport system ATP-binding protein
MDEAERCHELAILDRGRLVAAGAPRRLLAELPDAVVEVESDEPRAARAQLEREPAVRSAAQLGARLRALVDPALPDPAGALEAALAAHGVTARAQLAAPSLEDVFVAATRERRTEP